MTQSTTSSAHFPRYLRSLSVAALVCGAVSPVYAQTSSATVPADKAAPAPVKTAAPPSEAVKVAARAAYSAGQDAYKSGDYATASTNFAKANSLIPSAQAEYWLAMSLDLQGKPFEALQGFDALFANPNHTKLTPAQLEVAKQRQDVLKKIPATLTLSVTPATATVSVNGQVQSGTPPLGLKLPAGTHSIEVRAEGFESVETTINTRAAETLEQTIALQERAAPQPEAAAAEDAPAPVAAPPPVPPSSPPSKVPAYVTLGVAGASAVVGTIFGLQALSAKSDFDSSATDAHADDVERNALIADMAFGVALTLGITGVVLLTSDEPAEQVRAEAPRVAKTQLRLTPYVSPKGAGAAAHLTF